MIENIGLKKISGSKVFRLVSVVGLVTLLCCRHDGINVTTLDPVCFERDVLPIFQNSCATTGCHSAGGGKAGYDFSNYASILKTIAPSDAQGSKAYQAITGKNFVQFMPPKGAVSENDRIIIRVWIDQGAKNTTCSTTAANTGTTPIIPTTPVVVKSQQVCFQRDLLPVLVSSCAISGCHDQTTRRDGYNITTYASVMTNLVVAGNPTSSRLYTAVRGNSMPPKPYTALPQAVKDSLFNWIKNGARNDVCSSTACDTTGVVTYQKQIAALISLNCISCHSGSGAQKGILLDTYANVKTYLTNGKLMAAVKGTSIQMPPSYKLTTCEMRQFQLWQANGGVQN
ncbi:MAG: c-type cytochrome domain-containing protein [Prolixibacteraceae bacterium]